MMRAPTLLLVLCVAGCDASPASLGITGPGAPPPLPPASDDDSTIRNPGIPDPGGSYGPGMGSSSGRYFNYN